MTRTMWLLQFGSATGCVLTGWLAYRSTDGPLLWTVFMSVASFVFASQVVNHGLMIRGSRGRTVPKPWRVGENMKGAEGDA